jgi:hypothetical protein
LAGQAQAIELFTNFHYGENVGFPSMNVPVSMYGGIGRGGWNCRAIDQQPVDWIPPEPAVTPTGCTPAHAMGCKNCESAWNGYGQRPWGKHSRSSGNSAPVVQTPVYQYDSPQFDSESASPHEIEQETDRAIEAADAPTSLEAQPGVAPEEVSAPAVSDESSEPITSTRPNNPWPASSVLFPNDQPTE